LRVAFVAASSAWAALLVVAPLLASRAHVSTPTGGLLVGVYGVGSLVCHQLPERSYHLSGAQLPVCARCVGIYLGGAVAALLAAVFQTPRFVTTAVSGRSGFRSAERIGVAQRLNPVTVALAVAAVPTMLTLVYEWTTSDMPSHAIRTAAGVPIGLIVAWLVVAASDNQVN
jgi:hypothetical protein